MFSNDNVNWTPQHRKRLTFFLPVHDVAVISTAILSLLFQHKKSFFAFGWSINAAASTVISVCFLFIIFFRLQTSLISPNHLAISTARYRQALCHVCFYRSDELWPVIVPISVCDTDTSSQLLATLSSHTIHFALKIWLKRAILVPRKVKI